MNFTIRSHDRIYQVFSLTFREMKLAVFLRIPRSNCTFKYQPISRIQKHLSATAPISGHGIGTINLEKQADVANTFSDICELPWPSRRVRYGLKTKFEPIATAAGIGGRSENSSGCFFITFRMYFGSTCLFTSNVVFRIPKSIQAIFGAPKRAEIVG